MSTILKALRRLEEDKARGTSSRPLREEVASGPAETRRRRRGLPWLPIAAMLIGAGLGASAWWVWPYERGGEPVRDPVTGMPAATAPVVGPDEKIKHGPDSLPPPQDDVFHAKASQIEAELQGLAEAGPPEDAFASGVEVVERPTPVPRIAPAAEGAAPERVIADPPRLAVEPPAVTSRRARAREKAAASAAPRVATAPEPSPAPAPAKPPSVEPLRPAPAPAAAASTAVRPSDPRTKPAPEPRAPAPARVAAKSAPAPPAASRSSSQDTAVRVKRTQWHPEPGRRSADLEFAGKSESVHEGDIFGEYVVTEIRPSGVVLTRDGARIERGIGK